MLSQKIRAAVNAIGNSTHLSAEIIRIRGHADIDQAIKIGRVDEKLVAGLRAYLEIQPWMRLHQVKRDGTQDRRSELSGGIRILPESELCARCAALAATSQLSKISRQVSS